MIDIVEDEGKGIKMSNLKQSVKEEQNERSTGKDKQSNEENRK
ncbi:hypothetical protein [Virgibacillus salexigens]|uniref:Uncharacterized protein n=1 Tax=Virgibacillus massiliensis TaxID=1462526 RepID=A0A024QHM3_9BACI|nr:hypothetical protein [Virgibacillus massiliensis]CDQ41762.1 hypothetical protein BN990_04139 [Virgibacillus massiliensis]